MRSPVRTGLFIRLTGTDRHHPFLTGLKLTVLLSVCLWSLGPVIAVANDTGVTGDDQTVVTQPADPVAETPADSTEVQPTDPTIEAPAGPAEGEPTDPVVDVAPIVSPVETISAPATADKSATGDDAVPGSVSAQAVAAGRTQTTTISGSVRADGDGDGNWDLLLDWGRSGWTVNLDTNGDGTADISTTTGPLGGYLFSGLARNQSYSIWIEQRDGWTQTYPAANYDIYVGSSTSLVINKYFMVYEHMTMSGSTFNDLDDSGEWGKEEPALPGVTVYLDLNDNGDCDTGEPSTVTDDNGYYEFTDAPVVADAFGIACFWDWPDVYKIREIVPCGWEQTMPGCSGSYSFFRWSGCEKSGKDFGNYAPPASVSGTKWEDTNRNGIADAGDARLSGWTIFADLDKDGVPDAGEPVDVTDTNGNYTLDNLTVDDVAGTEYAITEVDQDLYSPVKPVTGSQTVTVIAGEDKTAVDFLNRHDLPPFFVVPPGGSDVINMSDGEVITANPFIIKVMPEDDFGVVRVEFYVDGVLIGVATAPDANGYWTCAWDTSQYHSSIRIVAYDKNGQTAVITRETKVMLTLPYTGK